MSDRLGSGAGVPWQICTGHPTSSTGSYLSVAHNVPKYPVAAMQLNCRQRPHAPKSWALP